jgi:hypothetical protein
VVPPKLGCFNKKARCDATGKSQPHSLQVRSLAMANDEYPGSITGACRLRLLIPILDFCPAAQRSIPRCRFVQGFHQSPALCAVVQRVLVLVTAFKVSPDYRQFHQTVNSVTGLPDSLGGRLPFCVRIHIGLPRFWLAFKPKFTEEGIFFQPPH